MTLQLSTAVRDAMNDQVETTIGTSPHLKIFTGSPPATCATADSGTLLADLTLPSDWLGASSSGTKSKSGTWQDASADGTGTAGYYRIYASGGTCHLQGTVTATGGGGDLTVDNTSFAAGQQFTISAYTLTMGGA